MNTTADELTKTADGLFKARSTPLEKLNNAIMAGFLNHYEDSDVKRTHLFGGRYENIYLNENHIPELKILGQEACRFANDILGSTDINAGYWFNYMPPGATTTAHSHDDYDELLSAVYYVVVPENSGDLIIHNKNEIVRIRPEKGVFVFFKPDVVHEVTENLSQQSRLSIGINFGIKKDMESI